MKAEIILDMPAQEYRAAPGLNVSAAKNLLITPLHFHKRQRVEQDETIDMRLGKIVHGYVLEGVAPKYIVRPTYDPSKPTEAWHGGRNSCKLWVADQEAQGNIVFSPDESLREVRMCDAIAESEIACSYLRACEAREVSIFADYRGVRIKARLDAAHIKPTRAAILDLKKCMDASPRGWGKTVAERKHLMQAVWYQLALALALGCSEPPAWAWLVVEDSDATPVQIYRPTSAQLAFGQAQVDRAIDIFVACTASGKWPGYGDDEMEFELPGWAQAEARIL